VKIVNAISFFMFACFSFATSGVSHSQETKKVQDLLISRSIGDSRYWQMDIANAPVRPPRYPKDLLSAGVSGCVAIGFFIEADGSTSGHRILQSKVRSNSNSRTKRSRDYYEMQFARAGVASIKAAKYLPGAENPNRIRGYSHTHFAYTADNESKLDCQIPDLVEFLMAMTRVE
jgi:hypothetical protein